MSKQLESLIKKIPGLTKKVTNPQTPDLMGDYRRSYKFKTKFGMLGPVASGKSTICMCVVYVLQVLSALIPDFYARVLPTSSHILADANNFRMGKFPKKTNPLKPKAPEAGILIAQRGQFGNKGVQVPICDVAGEITDYIYESCEGTPAQKIEARKSINAQVVDEIRGCQGFIIALDSNDALMFRTDENDNDVYIHSVMTHILEYRRRNHLPDPHIIVILTKWDEVMTKAKDINMDVYDGDYGLARFLDNGYPATSMLLKPLRDKGMVKFFRSWINLERNQQGETQYWSPNEPKIKIVEDANDYIRFKPSFSEPDYVELIRYIGSFG